MILYLWEERGRMVSEEVDDGQPEVRIEEGPPPKPQLAMCKDLDMDEVTTFALAIEFAGAVGRHRG